MNYDNAVKTNERNNRMTDLVEEIERQQEAIIQSVELIFNTLFISDPSCREESVSAPRPSALVDKLDFIQKTNKHIIEGLHGISERI